MLLYTTIYCALLHILHVASYYMQHVWQITLYLGIPSTAASKTHWYICMLWGVKDTVTKL